MNLRTNLRSLYCLQCWFIKLCLMTFVFLMINWFDVQRYVKSFCFPCFSLHTGKRWRIACSSYVRKQNLYCTNRCWLKKKADQTKPLQSRLCTVCSIQTQKQMNTQAQSLHHRWPRRRSCVPTNKQKEQEAVSGAWPWQKLQHHQRRKKHHLRAPSTFQILIVIWGWVGQPDKC